MKYLSVKEVSKLWEISGTMIRKCCTQGRIPGARQGELGWEIPANAKKPKAKTPSASRYDNLPKLARNLVRQKTKKSFHGLYDYVQINSAYSSSRMASNRLTRNQVESIFRKGKVRESFEPMKVSDLIEVMNHCVCMDYVLDHLEKPLSVKFIKAHRISAQIIIPQVAFFLGHFFSQCSRVGYQLLIVLCLHRNSPFAGV